MTYKGYEVVVVFDEDAKLLAGELINTREVITFQADSVDQVEQAFHASVDDYLVFCASRGEDPERLFSGTFSVRMSPEQHRLVATEARRAGKSINAWVVEKLSPKGMVA